ncbi:pirin family protein [Clostridium baratii]|uniref:Pirin n=1 Tax=Clostridium baratii TaxID=1561 RepID=A0A174RRT2_9CLOT|nr:pirin family protein [Clostridium baratii]CUP86741.1 pirin [Clostridium baratii]
MDKFRTIETYFKGPGFHLVGDGFHVSQYFPEGKDLLVRFSPFILLDYNAPYYFEPSNFRRGVGAHPHRGFETVTIAYAGKVEHHDNKGNHGVIGPGDVQWMTAGSGVLHKEYHEENFSKNGGILHMIQLWVNLPKKDKMTHPKYQSISKDDMGIYKLNNDYGEIKIIAGEVNGVKGPASTFSKINLYNVALKNFGKTVLSEPSNFNTGILVIGCKVKVNDEKTFEENDFILFDNVEGKISVESITETSLFIVLSGEPLNEPVASDGPFVMNTNEELLQAYDDFESGKFGTFNF